MITSDYKKVLANIHAQGHMHYAYMIHAYYIRSHEVIVKRLGIRKCIFYRIQGK